jgi:hypothetical protein
MKFAVVQPMYSQFVADETVVQAPYITTRGTSTTTTLSDNAGVPMLTCTCLSTNPYSPTDAPRSANCTQMQCEAQYAGQLYVEASGGNGASMTYYTDISVEPQTYTGGRNGTVYGSTTVQPGTVFTVSFGYDAEPAGSYSFGTGTQFPTAGGGGNGSLLGGSNGGGATVVSSKTVLLVAPGGGGAGRNGNGGDAGSSTTPLPFVLPLGSTNGSAGQLVVATVLPGGGGSTVGGTSSDPGGKGKSLQGGNATSQLASGGGGGSGFFGGGSGFTNSLPKPLAIHSPGGGGSSYSALALSDIPYIRNRVLQPTSNYVVFGFPSAVE